MGVIALSKLIRGIFFYTNSPNGRWLKVSVVFIIIATIIEVSPAAESACSKTSQALPQCVKQLVKELEYSDEVAENFASMVNQWQDKNKTSFLITLEDNLIKAKEGYKQGKISKRELAKTERGIAEKLIRRIRKEISVSDKFFDLANIIEHKQAQCLGYCQLFYILGTSVGLLVKSINVLELQSAGPLPAGAGHAACMVDLADGRTIMVNLVPAGFISFPFVLEDEFAKVGNCRQLKDKDNPLNIYRKIQLLDKKGLTAYLYCNRGVNYTSLGLLDKAAWAYDRAVNLNPDFAAVWSNRAAIYVRTGRFEQALSDYDQAIELNPDCAEAWSNRASAYIQLKQFEQAVSDCNRAIECDSHFAGAWNNRADAYAGLGQFDKAISDYNYAVRLNSKLVQAYYNRAIIYGILGEYKRAVSDLNRAVKLNPNLPQIYYCRANAYAKLKHFDKAIADYNRAIELRPGFAKARDNLEIAYALSGESGVAE